MQPERKFCLRGANTWHLFYCSILTEMTEACDNTNTVIGLIDK